MVLVTTVVCSSGLCEETLVMLTICYLLNLQSSVTHFSCSHNITYSVIGYLPIVISYLLTVVSYLLYL